MTVLPWFWWQVWYMTLHAISDICLLWLTRIWTLWFVVKKGIRPLFYLLMITRLRDCLHCITEINVKRGGWYLLWSNTNDVTKDACIVDPFRFLTKLHWQWLSLCMFLQFMLKPCILFMIINLMKKTPICCNRYVNYNITFGLELVFDGCQCEWCL